MIQTIVITGASAGVGRATARAFAAQGAQIGLLARGVDGLRGAAAEVEREGGKALIVPTDVSDADAVEAAADQVESRLGPIDVWVNCAMATTFAPFHRITPKEYQRTTDVIYHGFVHGTMAALKRMRPRNRGTIVQVGSALAYHGVPLQAAYCGAKFAIRGFTQCLQSELIHDGVDVHLAIVQMPALNTPQFNWARNKMSRRPQPLPPIFQPEVAAEAILFAARSRRREVWVGRSTVMAIIGAKMAPGLLNRYLAKKGYTAQLTDEPTASDQPDDLFAPVPGDAGAHGRFDEQASVRSPQLWATKHRRSLATAGVMLSAFAGAYLLRASRALSRVPTR